MGRERRVTLGSDCRGEDSEVDDVWERGCGRSNGWKRGDEAVPC